MRMPNEINISSNKINDLRGFILKLTGHKVTKQEYNANKNSILLTFDNKEHLCIREETCKDALSEMPIYTYSFSGTFDFSRNIEKLKQVLKGKHITEMSSETVERQLKEGAPVYLNSLFNFLQNN